MRFFSPLFFFKFILFYFTYFSFPIVFSSSVRGLNVMVAVNVEGYFGGLYQTDVITSLMALPVSDDADVGSFGEHKWHLNNRLILF